MSWIASLIPVFFVLAIAISVTWIIGGTHPQIDFACLRWPDRASCDRECFRQIAYTTAVLT